jgi:uncharacterized protein YceK
LVEVEDARSPSGRWLAIVGKSVFALTLFGDLCITGCGSISNLSEGPGMHEKRVRTVPYGGVLIDAEVLAEPCTDPEISVFGSVFAVLFGLIDLPLSIVVDTLTLPYTIPKALSYPAAGSRTKPEAYSESQPKRQ